MYYVDMKDALHHITLHYIHSQFINDFEVQNFNIKRSKMFNKKK